MNCDRRIRLEGSKLPCNFYIRTGVQNQPGFCSLPWHFRCIEAIARLLPRLSKSAVETWDTCRRKYLLNNIMGIVLRPDKIPVELAAGLLWDRFIQQVHIPDTDLDNELVLFHGACADMIKESPELEYPLHRVMALATALVEMGFKPFAGIQMQRDITKEIEGYAFKAVMDGWLPQQKTIVEAKLTGSPDWYFDTYNIYLQAGLYFLTEPEAEKLYMMVARRPNLLLTGKYKEESAEDHYSRTLKDIRSRPTHYFPGWSQDDHTFYKAYYRNEFDLVELKALVGAVGREIREACTHDVTWFRQRRTSCKLYGRECEYLSICDTGVISEGKYTERRPDEPLIIDSEFMQQLRKESNERLVAQGIEPDTQAEIVAEDTAKTVYKAKKKKGKPGKMEAVEQFDFMKGEDR